MAVFRYIDTVLVPLSFFLTIGYHAYLWYHLKRKPSITTIGMESIKRRHWLRDMRQGDDTQGTLAVQSLRNTLMSSILVAMATSLVAVALVALINNTYGAKNLMRNSFFGLNSNKILCLKYGSALLFLLASFMCSSMAVASLIDANYLIYALGAEPEEEEKDHHDHSSRTSSSDSCRKYTRSILERGFMLAVFGNRMLCISVPLLFWLFSPVVLAVASLALVWGLYMLDFVQVPNHKLCY